MTAESERGSSDPNAGNEATSRPETTPDNTKASGTSAADKSPEVLRTRADSLLDEMMLGAVDVSAAETRGSDTDASDHGTKNVGRYDAGETGPNDRNRHHPDTYGPPRIDLPAANEQRSDGNGAGYARSDNGYRTSAEPASTGYNGLGASSDNTVSAGRTHSQDPVARGADLRQNGMADENATPQPTPEWRVKTGGVSGGDDAAWSEYVSSFRSPSNSSSQIQKWQPDSPADGFTSSTSEPSENRSTAVNPDSTPPSRSASAESPRQPNAGAEPEGGTGYVSAMSVMSSGPRRSSLLPRMSRFDVDALNREIAELHEEIRALLPIGHAQAERAQHLLDKAYTIAESDPQRSAEVEYYMQQVRTIVERTRQSRRWSNLYRDRLRIYLIAWTLLSGLTLTALLLSQFQIEALVAEALGTSRNTMFMRNFAGGLGCLMAGALGGALGSLINMRRHARTQYGFFDRKYGLRGLMLPVIGAVVGILIYAVFAVFYSFAGINPSLSAVAMAVPALLAFVFGFGQETLYGTTG